MQNTIHVLDLRRNDFSKEGKAQLLQICAARKCTIYLDNVVNYHKNLFL